LYSSQADFANISFSPVSSGIFFISFLFMAFTNKVCGSKKGALAIPSESKHLLIFIFGNKGEATDFFVIIFLSQSENKRVAIAFFQFKEAIAIALLLQNVGSFKIKHCNFFHRIIFSLLVTSSIIERSLKNLVRQENFIHSFLLSSFPLLKKFTMYLSISFEFLLSSIEGRPVNRFIVFYDRTYQT